MEVLKVKRFFLAASIVAVIIVLAVPPCFAQADQAADSASNALAEGLKYIAAAIAVGLSAIATGIAQSRIGAAGMGSIVEKPETMGTVLICLAIPETMVILGFVVAAMIIIL
jgi:V/A-type H+-transporting ATPase subunit K